MQSKVFAAAFAALSFSSVQAAVVPRATISPAYIVLPGISFDPSTLPSQQLAFQTLDSLRNEIGQTAALVNEITVGSTANALSTVAQVNAVVAQATVNAANILTKVTTLANTLQSAVPPAPSAPAVNTPDIGGAAEDVVRQAQVLARAITAQLNALKAQATGTAAGVLTPVIAAAQVSLQAALATVGTASNLALSAAANAVANVQALADRVRNAQVKLSPVLIIGAQPDIVF